MQVGTVVSKYAINATAWLRGFEEMTSAYVKQSVAIQKSQESMREWAKESKLVAAGTGLVRKEVKSFTDHLSQNAKDLIGHRAAVRSYKQEMGALNTQLVQLNGTASRTGDVSKQLFNLAGLAATVAIVKAGIGNLKQFTESAMKASAEVETLDTVLGLMGKNAGYSIGFLRDQVDELRHSGIEAAASARGITDFLKTGLPLDRIKELSRLAQDLAVIGGSNSTESFQRVLWGITTGQTDVLRVAGLNVSFETAYAKAAAAAKKSVSSLTEAEKLQARLNEVMKQAPTVAGAYEAAMGTAGKQLSSMPRLIDDVRVALGNTLLPVFTKAIFATNAWLKALRALIENGPLGNWLKDQATTVAKAIESISSKLTNMMSGVNMEKILGKLDAFMEKVKSLGKVGGAGLAGMFSGLLAQLPLIGKFLAPFTGWQVAVAAFIASNAELRKGLGDIIKAVIGAASQIANSLLPAFQALGGTAEGAGSKIGAFAQYVARQITIFGNVASILISTAIPAIKNLIGVFKVLWEVVSLNPLNYFIKWVLQFVGSSENARMAILSLLIAVKMFAGFLVSGLKSAALWSAFSGIQRAVGLLNGDMNAFNGFLTESVNRMKSAAIVAGVYAVAVFGISLMLQEMAKYQANAQKHFETLFSNANESGGTVKVLETMNQELVKAQGNVARANKSVEMFSGTSSGLLKTIDVLTTVIPGLLSIKNGLQGKFNPFETISQMIHGYKAEVDIKAIQAATKGILDELRTSWKNITDQVNSQTATAVQELQSSKDAIAKAVGGSIDPGALAKMTPGMVKAYDDSLAQINQTVDSWAEGFTGIGGAILDKEVETWDDLMNFYSRQVERLAAFWQGVDWLKAMGLNQSMIDELIKGGPEKFGAALQNMMVQANTMSPEALQAQIDTLNSQKALADNITKYEEQKYAQQALMSDEYQKKIQEEADVQQKAFNDLVRNQVTGLGSLRQGIDAVVVAFNSQSGVTQGAKDQMSSYLATLMLNLDKAEAAIRSGSAIDASAISKNLNDILSLLPENLMGYGLTAMQGLNAIVASNNQLVATSADLGIKAGAGFASKFQSVVQAALAAVPTDIQAKLGVPGAADKQLAEAKAAAQAQDAKVKLLQSTQSVGNLYPQAPDDKAIKAAEDTAKRIADVYKNNPPLKLFGEAMDEVWGKQERYINASHGMVDASEGLAKTIIDLSRSTDTAAQRHRKVEDAVMGAVKAIREEVEAMADLGMIGNSVEEMTAATGRKINELSKNLPNLIANMNGLTASLENVDDTLNAVHASIDKTLGRFMDAQEATYGVQDAIDSLSQAYLDQQDLLTNTKLSDKDIRNIKKATNKELIASVRAIQAEAKALAANGEIGADAASQTKYMQEQLQKLAEQFPELIPQIDQYSKLLVNVPEDVKTTTELEIADAMNQLATWRNNLAAVPAVAQTKLQVLLDDAALSNAVDSASTFNSLRLGDLNTERSIANAMWDQVLALEMQKLHTTSGNSFLDNIVNGIITYVIGTINNIRGIIKGYDSGGVLPPGSTMAVNKTGANEFVFTPAQVQALYQMSPQLGGAIGSGGGGNITIDKLVVQSNDPPRQWLNEGLWKASRGFGQPVPSNTGNGGM